MKNTTSTTLPELPALLRALKEGQRAPVELFVKATYQSLFVLAARLTGDSDEAEDVLQDGYMRAFAAISAGTTPLGSINLAWLRCIVTRVAIDLARRRGYERVARARFMPEDRVALPSGEASVALRQLQQWLSELPSEQRTALVLKELEGMAVSEIAKILGTSEGAIEQRLVRARDALRGKKGADDE